MVNAERIQDIEAILMLIIAIECTVVCLFVVGSKLNDMMNTIPETSYYLRNCNNLTLFPDGCQVLS